MTSYEEEVVLIDCPPSFGLIVASALLAARSGVLVPVAVEDESLDGLAQLMQNIAALRERFDQELPIVGVVPTKLDLRTRNHREIMQTLEKHCDGELRTAIRSNIRLQELFAKHLPIRTHAPASSGAADYAALSREIGDRLV